MSYSVASGTDRTDISKAKVTLVQGGKTVKGVEYTGREITFSASDSTSPQIALKVGKTTLDSKAVEENFDIYYADNVEKGKATIVLKAKDGSPYIGACSGTFTIASGKIGK